MKSNDALDLYLPSTVLVTGFDIIFFWVARMVMMTKHITGKIPFKHVYVHGLIRDAEGQKMSKSKGNVLDPIDLIDGIGIDALVEKRTTGLMNPKQAEQIERSTRKEFPKASRPSAPTRCASPSPASPSPGRDIKFDLQPLRGLPQLLQQAVERHALRADERRRPRPGARPQQMAGGAARARRRRSQPRISASPTAGSSAACSAEAEVEQHFADYRFDLLARTDLRIRLGRVLRLVSGTRQGADADRQRGPAARHARRTLVRVLENRPAPGPPADPVHHRGTVADRRPAAAGSQITAHTLMR
jgi:valyl-tRNA synthetase